jgi:DNA polymerase-1
MTRRLLLVDGSNLVMRAAFGGERTPEQATPVATSMLARAIVSVRPAYMICVFDPPTDDVPLWRSVLAPTYKTHRQRKTKPYIQHAMLDWSRRGWLVDFVAGFEADDVIASRVSRGAAGDTETVVLSGDSDLLALCGERVRVAQYRKGNGADEHGIASVAAADVCERYGLTRPIDLLDVKAIVGEPGDLGGKEDNGFGVPGMGMGRAVSLVRHYGSLEQIITAGDPRRTGGETLLRHAQLVARYADRVRLTRRLVDLRTDVPVTPVAPRLCAILDNHQEARAS